MKDNIQVILFAVIFAFVGFRLYQKFIKKSDGKTGDVRKPSSPFGSASKDDDYEPYSGK